MSKAYTHITESEFHGIMNEELYTMNGFGVYMYPNKLGQYRGFFKDGLFHGYGNLKMFQPRTFECKGEFLNGEIINISEITFPDGLHLTCSYSNGKLNFSNWTYCTKSERRYSTELAMGLEPVGGAPSLTNKRPARAVPSNCYDTEEGFYMPKTGFIKPHREQARFRFVYDPAEIKWIKRNCRTSATQPQEPDVAVKRRLLENNFEVFLRMKIMCICTHRNLGWLSEYWQRNVKDQDSKSLHQLTATSSRSSFSDRSIIDTAPICSTNIEDRLEVPDDGVGFTTNRSLMQQRPSVVFVTQRFGSEM